VAGVRPGSAVGALSTHRPVLVGLLGADPLPHRAHPLHSTQRSYAEVNCYTDVLIELLHARGEEPLAAMGAALRVDFEGDQWTFLKPMPEDLERMFALDIHEMQPYRPIPWQALEQIAEGRMLIVELDSWYLPDASPSYRREHLKSSVAIESIDPDGERMRYFHGTGLYELEGEDYRGVFRLGPTAAGDVLPPYTELVRFDRGRALRGEALRAAARERLGEHLSRRPDSNPFLRYGQQLESDLERLLAGDEATYHAYAFATVRMAGSAFEVAGTHVEWVLGPAAAAAAAALAQVVEGCKALSFRLARRRAFDPRPAVSVMAEAWEEAMGQLDGELP